MSKLVSDAQWAAFKSLIKNGHDTFSQDTLVWRRAKRVIKRYREDGDVLSYENIPLKCLVGYNTFRTWPITKRSETGELDNQNQLIYLNREYLQELGYLNSQGYLAFNPGADEFFHRGSVYKAEGDTLASQAHDDPLLFLLVLRRKALLTRDDEFNVFIEIPLTIESGILDLIINVPGIDFGQLVEYPASNLLSSIDLVTPLLGLGNTRTPATQQIIASLLDPLLSIPSLVTGNTLLSSVDINNIIIKTGGKVSPLTLNHALNILSAVITIAYTRRPQALASSLSILDPTTTFGFNQELPLVDITVSVNAPAVLIGKGVILGPLASTLTIPPISLPNITKLTNLTFGISTLQPVVLEAFSYTLAADEDTLEITTNPVSITVKKTWQQPNPEILSINEPASTPVTGFNNTVLASANTIVIKTLSPSTLSGRIVTAELNALEISTLTPTIVFGRSIAAEVNTLEINTLTPTLVVGKSIAAEVEELDILILSPTVHVSKQVSISEPLIITLDIPVATITAEVAAVFPYTLPATLS